MQAQVTACSLASEPLSFLSIVCNQQSSSLAISLHVLVFCKFGHQQSHMLLHLCLTSWGAWTTMSGSSGKLVGRGGSLEEESVAADCLSWLSGAVLAFCVSAV